jgi:hypothetical protein
VAALAYDKALALAADDILRGRQGAPVMDLVDLSGPLARAGVRGRLVHGVQSRFMNVGADQLVSGLMGKDWERGHDFSP